MQEARQDRIITEILYTKRRWVDRRQNQPRQAVRQENKERPIYTDRTDWHRCEQSGEGNKRQTQTEVQTIKKKTRRPITKTHKPWQLRFWLISVLKIQQIACIIFFISNFPLNLKCNCVCNKSLTTNDLDFPQSSPPGDKVFSLHHLKSKNKVSLRVPY